MRRPPGSHRGQLSERPANRRCWLAPACPPFLRMAFSTKATTKRRRPLQRQLALCSRSSPPEFPRAHVSGANPPDARLQASLQTHHRGTRIPQPNPSRSSMDGPLGVWRLNLVPRFVSGMPSESCQATRAFGFGRPERVWEAAHVQLAAVNLDTDTTVHTRFGHQISGRKSYNLKNRGKEELPADVAVSIRDAGVPQRRTTQ
jgi:hypothetical protein